MRKTMAGHAHLARTLACTLALGLGGLGPLALSACGSAPAGDVAPVEATETTAEATVDEGDAASTGTTGTSQMAAALADGTYEIEVTTDSSMFRSERCTLEVTDGSMVCHLALPGEGFSRLYFGSAEQAEAAAAAGDADVYDYRIDEDGLYTFDLPVTALDEELAVAAFGQRRDTWYDHTITFASPAGEAVQG